VRSGWIDRDRCIPGWSARYRRPVPGSRRQRARVSRAIRNWTVAVLKP